MSDWLFDLGNSRFKFAPLQGTHAGDVQAWPHGAEAMPADAPALLPLLGDAQFQPALVLDGLARWAVHQPPAAR